jgi:hypothetical protein
VLTSFAVLSPSSKLRRGRRSTDGVRSIKTYYVNADR